MKLLSLWEPWATLMATGAKRIETRSWGTSYRGWLAIQASKGGLNQGDLLSTCSDEPFSRVLRGNVPWDENRGFVFPRGHIVAVVRLFTCQRTEWLTAPAGAKVQGSELITAQELAFGDYAHGRYGWITDQPFRLPEPIPYKAKQGLVTLDYETIAQIQEQWRKSRVA